MHLPSNSEILVEDLGNVVVAQLAGSQTVTCYLTSDAASEDVEHGLRDLVLPKLLASQGNLVLHGGLVARAGCSGFCLIGSSGHGKSTLSASFRAAGFDLLSDDSILIDPTGSTVTAEGLCASPRLFPDSLTHVFPGVISSAPVASYMEKRRVQLEDITPARAAVTTIFLVSAPDADTGDVSVRPMPQAAACMALVANSFALAPADPTESRQRFALAAQVARRIPLLELSYPRDYARLPDVQAAILHQLNSPQARHAKA